MSIYSKLKSHSKEVTSFKRWCDRNNKSYDDSNVDDFLSHVLNKDAITDYIKEKELTTGITRRRLMDWIRTHNKEFNFGTIDEYVNVMKNAPAILKIKCKEHSVPYRYFRDWCIANNIERNEDAILQYKINHRSYSINPQKISEICKQHNIRYSNYTSWCYKRNKSVNIETFNEYFSYLQSKKLTKGAK